MDEERLDRILQNFAMDMSCALERYPSLRDQFAMHCLSQTLCLTANRDNWEPATAALFAYEIADAMLAAREAGK